MNTDEKRLMVRALISAGRSYILVACLSITLVGASGVAGAQVPVPKAEPATQVDLAQLTAEERADLLSRLSDEQVRDLILAYLKARAAPKPEEVLILDEVHQEISLFRERFGERWTHIGELSSVPGFIYAKLSEGRGPYHPLVVFGLFIGITLLAYAVERGYRRGARRLYEGLVLPADAEALQRLARLVAKLCLDLLGIAVFAAAILGLFFLLYHDHWPTRQTVMTLLTALLIVRIAAAVSQFFFAPGAPKLRIAPFDDESAGRIHRWIVAATAVTAFGMLTCGLMLRFGLDSVWHELLVDMVATILAITLIVGALRLQKAVAGALLTQIEGDRALQRAMRSLASLWHVAFIAYVVFLLFLSTYKDVIGEQSTSVPGLLSLLIVVLIPGMDFFLRSLLDHFMPARQSEVVHQSMSALPVFKRAARILTVILALFLLGRVWGVNFFDLGKESFGEEIMRAIVDIALTLLAAYVAWGAIKAGLARYLPLEAEEGEGAHGGDEGGAASASRLETIMPLIIHFIRISLVVIVMMILLSSLGVNIGPLLAGAGVVGLAVGFGAQTLVRDVVSGLFFLMDDAFRKGEYVDIGSVKGTVEAINIRSLVLRHHLGILHTVPYGEIQHLSNFSRDWVIVKMEFRVPTDTDINRVKKIFKKIGTEMLEHPDLGADFLQPFKSQGVKAIEDSAIIVRGKFMSKPGRQFMLRKELYNRVQQAFHESRIEFAHRKVTVELPSNVTLSPEQAKRLSEAAGAAALAVEEAEKESQHQDIET